MAGENSLMLIWSVPAVPSECFSKVAGNVTVIQMGDKLDMSYCS